MDSKSSQKAWMAIVIWLGLTAATAYTSNATYTVFNAIISALFSALTNGISDLFTNYGVLFTVILSIVLIFLVVSAWLGVAYVVFFVTDYKLNWSWLLIGATYTLFPVNFKMHVRRLRTELASRQESAKD